MPADLPISARDPDVADFLKHQRVVRNLSPHSLRAYRVDLDLLCSWLRDHRGKAVVDADRDDLREFAMHLHSSLAPSSVARRMATMRSLYRHLRRTERLAVDIAEGLRNPKQVQTLPKVLSVDQVLQLLRAVAPPKDPRLAARDLALIELIYGAGLRVSEAVGLRLRDLDLDQQLARVKGKGAKVRLSPFGGPAVAALRAWLRARQEFLEGRADDPQQGHLFLNTWRGPLSTRSVRRLLEKRCLAAGLPRVVGPHALRHSFATHLLDEGAGIRDVQELLGHEQLSTTQRYTHVSLVAAQRKYDAAHPRARLKDSP